MKTESSGVSNLLGKWLLVNTFWLAILGACWHQGWLSYIFAKDVTFISHGIAIGMLFALGVCFMRAMSIDKKLSEIEVLGEEYTNSIEEIGEHRRADVSDALQTQLLSGLSAVDYLATTALAVGVLGTVVGLIMGFSNLDPSAIQDISNVGPAVSQLLVGLSVAFHTTLVGGIANVWLKTNHFILFNATSSLFAGIITSNNSQEEMYETDDE